MEALLLLGPTGVGKTPLGDLMEVRGLPGRRCGHFDFGLQLRRAAGDPRAAAGLDADARAVIRRVLADGALLEDHEFAIAATLLQAFLAASSLEERDLLLLNGLPRHLGQAAEIDRMHRVRAVLQLDAPAGVIQARILRDTGGDRAGRTDDETALVAGRIERYRARSAPLVEHYATRGAYICRIPVGVATTAEETYARVVAGAVPWIA